ncbi:MAG: hypothetical protein AAB269_00130, partial [Bacteroidota bacterium]
MTLSAFSFRDTRSRPVPSVEKDASGQDVRLRGTLTGEKLVVSSFGGETDYTITFISISAFPFDGARIIS